MTPKTLVLMRGLPGSGKSHTAHELAAAAKAEGRSVAVYGTDEYFTTTGPDGKEVYRYDKSKAEEYHRANQARASLAMAHGIDVVFIDNTNTTSAEVRPYITAALEHGYKVTTAEPNSPQWLEFQAARRGNDARGLGKALAKLAALNSHGVSLEDLERMAARWEDDFDSDLAHALEPPLTVAAAGPAAPTTTTLAEKIGSVAEWLLAGLRTSQLAHQWAKAGWGALEPADVETILEAAHDIIRADARIRLDVEQAKAIGRLNDLYSRSLAIQDAKTALRIQLAMNELLSRLANPMFADADADQADEE